MDRRTVTRISTQEGYCDSYVTPVSFKLKTVSIGNHALASTIRD